MYLDCTNLSLSPTPTFVVAFCFHITLTPTLNTAVPFARVRYQRLYGKQYANHRQIRCAALYCLEASTFAWLCILTAS